MDTDAPSGGKRKVPCDVAMAGADAPGEGATAVEGANKAGHSSAPLSPNSSAKRKSPCDSDAETDTDTAMPDAPAMRPSSSSYQYQPLPLTTTTTRPPSTYPSLTDALPQPPRETSASASNAAAPPPPTTSSSSPRPLPRVSQSSVLSTIISSFAPSETQVPSPSPDCEEEQAPQTLVLGTERYIFHQYREWWLRYRHSRGRVRLPSIYALDNLEEGARERYIAWFCVEAQRLDSAQRQRTETLLQRTEMRSILGSAHEAFGVERGMWRR